MSETIGISDHLGGFPLRRGCPGEKVAWFSPRSPPTMGSLTRFVPQPQTPPGLTTSPRASLPASPAVGLSTSKILSDGSGGIEPPRHSAILPCPEGQGLTRHLVKSEEKRNGKTVGIAVRTVSPDAKVLTITDEGANRKGQAFPQVLVFDRQ